MIVEIKSNGWIYPNDEYVKDSKSRIALIKTLVTSEDFSPSFLDKYDKDSRIYILIYENYGRGWLYRVMK